MDERAAPQAAARDGLPRTGRACNTCRQPVTVAGGDPETGGTVLHAGERNEGDVGHVAAPIEAPGQGPRMMVYPWEAGTATGVADDDTVARERAEAAMLENGARTAVVDTAWTGGPLSLDGTYMRWGGLRWTACRTGSAVTWTCGWEPGGSPGKLAAS